jgi:hypothetical protein
MNKEVEETIGIKEYGLYKWKIDSNLERCLADLADHEYYCARVLP